MSRKEEKTEEVPAVQEQPKKDAGFIAISILMLNTLLSIMINSVQYPNLISVAAWASRLPTACLPPV